MHRVSVIDVGSNTIKLLVAEKSSSGDVTAVHSSTLHARLGEGINADQPRLNEPSMARALAAIETLLTESLPFRAEEVALVATSAVRDAINGIDFAQRVERATNRRLEIISGDREAELIGRGIAADPAIRNTPNFYIFDLGGGSLECLSVLQRQTQQNISLPLGSVRLLERCVARIDQPFTLSDRQRIAAATQEAFQKETFRFDLPSTAIAVGAGGAFSSVRSILAARSSVSFNETNPNITVDFLESLLEECAAMDLAQRQKLPGLQPPRADIFPTALTTVIELARLANVTAFTHSLYNLRYGLAANLLDAT